MEMVDKDQVVEYEKDVTMMNMMMIVMMVMKMMPVMILLLVEKTLTSYSAPSMSKTRRLTLGFSRARRKL